MIQYNFDKYNDIVYFDILFLTMVPLNYTFTMEHNVNDETSLYVQTFCWDKVIHLDGLNCGQRTQTHVISVMRADSLSARIPKQTCCGHI